MTNQTNRLLWTGRVVSALVVVFFLFDAAMKIIAISPVIEATTKLGYAVSDVRPMGACLLLATILFAIPRTAVLGALIATAYLGGATATMVHAGQSWVFPVVMGVMVWAGLVMRRPELLRTILVPSLV
ncbi:MAG TPA: DoxX family protein [Kofleriaceae bacterium]|jgi:hypothetical protein|nr:DoxX family protein [Kofleriaceae bacterium]